MRARDLRKSYVVIMVMIQIGCWICATSRPVGSNHVSCHQDIRTPHDAYHSFSRPTLKPIDRKDMEKGRRIGSKPPSCEKKCYGCEPCEAIQVPTISSIPHLSPHYANYEPEGWRCHCTP